MFSAGLNGDQALSIREPMTPLVFPIVVRSLKEFKWIDDEQMNLGRLDRHLVTASSWMVRIPTNGHLFAVEHWISKSTSFEYMILFESVNKKLYKQKYLSIWKWE